MTAARRDIQHPRRGQAGDFDPVCRGRGNLRLAVTVPRKCPAGRNAGFVESTAGVVETSEADWQHALSTNLTSVWLCMKYEIPEMVKRQRAAIVNNGSVVGQVGSGVAVGSVATKHGVSGLTKAAALEYAMRGIRVNAVALGMVRTPLAERMVNSLPPGAEQAMLSVVPQGRWCEPDEVAEVVVFLCSDAASHGPFACWTAIVGLIDVTLIPVRLAVQTHI